MIKLWNDDIKYMHQVQRQQETTRNVVESVSELEIEQHTTAIVGNSMEQIIRERATAEPTKTTEPSLTKNASDSLCSPPIVYTFAL